jgi:hypothetical protein
MPFSEYERCKWETLDHLFHRFGLDAAWYAASIVAPDDPEKRRALVRRVVLDLLDNGLIFGAYASRDDGYKLRSDEFVPVPDEVVKMELDRPADYIEPEERLLWLLPTEKAEDVWQSLPPEAFLRAGSASGQKT